MEILKPGKTATLDRECPECGCVFRYNVRDVLLVWSHKGEPTADGKPKQGDDGNVELTTCVKCPCCGKTLPSADGKPTGRLLL